MSTRKFVAAALLVVLLVVSSYGQEEPAKETGLKINDLGQEPRVALRYSLAEGQTETMIMLMDMAMTSTTNGQTMPQMKVPRQRMEMSCKVDRVTEEGHYEVSFSLDKVELIEDAPSPMSAQMKPMLEKMVGMNGRYVVTQRGELISQKINLPEGAPAMLRQQMENIEQSITQCAVPLPEEAVGVGANWTVTKSLEMPQFKVVNKMTYKVAEVADDAVMLDVTIEQTAPPQDMSQQGVTMKLTSMKSDGLGKIKLTPTRLVPTSKATMNMEMNMNMQFGDKAMTLNNKMDMVMQIQPGEDDAP